MLRARRDPNELHPDKNNVWIVLDEPEIETPKSGLILPVEYIERRMRETKKVFEPTTLPWSVETEEQALAAVLKIKDYFEAEVKKEAAEVKPEPKGKADKKAPVDTAAQVKLDAAIAEGAKALRDQLADKADNVVAHEPQDTTLLRVLADVVTKAGPAIREQGLDRRALINKLRESLPPKN